MATPDNYPICNIKTVDNCPANQFYEQYDSAYNRSGMVFAVKLYSTEKVNNSVDNHPYKY